MEVRENVATTDTSVECSRIETSSHCSAKEVWGSVVSSLTGSRAEPTLGATHEFGHF